MIDTWKKWWGETMARYVRVMAGFTALCLVIIGFDPLLNANSPAFDTPIFAVVERIASLQAWGAVFWLAGAAMLLAAISGRFVLYIPALALATLVQSAWFGSVMWARTFDQAPLTSTGIGLWMLALSATIGTALTPTQLAVGKPVAVVLDSTVVPLDRAS